MALSVSENIRYSNSMFSVFVFILLLFFYRGTYDEYKMSCKKDRGLAVFLSAFFSIFLHFGASLETMDNVNFPDLSMWIYIICLSIALSPVILWLWGRISDFSIRVTNDNKNEENFKFLQIWFIIFLLWLPVFFALYPGAFVYDAQDEYIEVISRSFTMHQPLFHVLLLGGIIHLAEYMGLATNIGIAAYVLFQMLIMSAVLAYSIRLLYKWGIAKRYLVIVMAFYGLFPLFPMYAVCTAKDSLFTVFFYLIVLLLTDYIKSKDGEFFSIPNMTLFIMASVLMMLLRNNGVYAYAAAIPVILLLGLTDKRNTLYRLIVLMALSVVLFFGTSYVLKTATAATDNEHQEALTVPIQQLARVYTYSKDTFTEEELVTLYEILPEEYLNTYCFRLSDICKSGFDNANYSKNPGKYRRLWALIGIRKPLIYINAWFGTSYGYWYPDAINNVYAGNEMYTFSYKDSSYFGFETEPPGKRESKLVLLEEFYRKLSLEIYQQKIPVISMLFSPGFVFWIFALIFIMLLRDNGLRMADSKDGVKLIRSYNRMVPLVIVALLWCTLLLGPTTLVRYVLILWMIKPVYPVLINENEKK